MQFFGEGCDNLRVVAKRIQMGMHTIDDISDAVQSIKHSQNRCIAGRIESIASDPLWRWLTGDRPADVQEALHCLECLSASFRLARYYLYCKVGTEAKAAGDFPSYLWLIITFHTDKYMRYPYRGFDLCS